ncbi:MAG: Hsp33 family molecular chaperone HslO [Oceanospirillaceae bacterium]|nr:Hsp33 family molecular chaperone HslO [Oceanospirillaceae bacterium]
MAQGRKTTGRRFYAAGNARHSQTRCRCLAALCHLADTIKTEELLYLANDELLHRLYHEESVRLYDASGLSFRCSCSRAHVWAMRCTNSVIRNARK